MKYDLNSYGFKKVTEDWFWYSDNSQMMHLCDRTPDSTGLYPKKFGTSKADGSCGECDAKLPPNLQIIYNLQVGFQAYKEDG